MTDIIKALQDEIEAAETRWIALRKMCISAPMSLDAPRWMADARFSHGYIKGLQTAVDLLTKEQARELPY